MPQESKGTRITEASEKRTSDEADNMTKFKKRQNDKITNNKSTNRHYDKEDNMTKYSKFQNDKNNKMTIRHSDKRAK